jgi:hypothetical protein
MEEQGHNSLQSVVNERSSRSSSCTRADMAKPMFASSHDPSSRPSVGRSRELLLLPTAAAALRRRGARRRTSTRSGVPKRRGLRPYACLQVGQLARDTVYNNPSSWSLDSFRPLFPLDVDVDVADYEFGG